MYWNLNWKSPGFLTFGANLTHFCRQTWHLLCKQTHIEQAEQWQGELDAERADESDDDSTKQRLESTRTWNKDDESTEH